MGYKSSKELKEMITKPNIDLRQVFRRYSKKMPRRASFIGSVNEPEFLFDITGNRRFLCFAAQSFANHGNHGVDMDMVFAEAYQLYLDGFQYWINAEEQKIIEENNQQFLVVSAEEEKLLDVFSPTPPFEETPRFYFPKHVPINDKNYIHQRYIDESKSQWRNRVRWKIKRQAL